MRERLEAAAAPGAAVLRAVPAVARPEVAEEVGTEPTVAPLAPAVMTTRERIVNRALAEREAVPAEEPRVEAAAAEPAGVVVEIAPLRDRRRREAPAVPPPPEGPLAPVVVLRGPEAARAPPPTPAEVVPAVGPEAAPTARAPPPAPEAEPVPPAAGAPARAEAVPAAPAPEPVPGVPAAEAAPPAPAPEGAVPAAEPELAPPAEREAAPPAEPEAAPAAEPGAAPPTREAAPAPEVAAVPAAPPGVPHGPEEEPGFQAMKEKARRAAARTKRHQSGREASGIAQGASEPDKQKDVQSQAATDQVAEMDKKEPGPFDAAKFKEDVKKKVESMAPPATLEEADEFEETGKAAGATSFMAQLVQRGRAEAEHQIKTTTEAPPDPSGKKPKDVSKMVHDPRGVRLPDVGAAAAMPAPRPAWMTDLSRGPLQVEAKIAEANLTEPQLAEANEPEFTAALEARREVQEHAATAPGDYRVQEELVLARGRAEAENVAGADLEGMRGARIGTVTKVVGEKDATKTRDEQLRNDIHQAILDIHEQTQTDVMNMLATLDSTVEQMFTDGEKAAREKFERYVDEKMTAYKADRYSGVFGPGRWLWDKAFDLPDEVNDFYRDGRQTYIDDMDRVIEGIAVFVGVMLGLAKVRIAVGREQVRAYVAQLDEGVRSLGDEVAADLDNRFDQLDADVDAKRDELVDVVARKYVEARDDLDKRIEELKEANKGFVTKAIDFVVSVAKTVYELGKLLVRVLLKAAAAIGDIIAHPIRFLENLVGAVKGGLDRFVERIDVHLQNALIDLLFGEIGRAGIKMPPQLDFAGILDLVLQVLGLDYASIRERLVARFGEPVVAKMEEAVDIFKTLLKDGIGGLWTLILEKIADLEDLVIGKLKEYIVERVVKAGISYIVALLNPAAAFIKACQTIYQIVMFVVERAKQIAEFVESVIDSIGAIAQGNVGAAVERIESALASGLSLVIGFLARLANLGALSEKVRSIIALVRKPITRAVDTIVMGAAQLYRRTIGPVVAFAKAKVEAGREWAKAKVEAGRELAKRKLEGVTVRPSARAIAEEPEVDPEQAGREDELARPVRVAQDDIEVAPGEKHTVFAQLAPTGQIDIGMTSTPQLVTDIVGHFEPRIETLPQVPPVPLPKGGKQNDRPRMQAEAATRRIAKEARKLDLDFERDYDARQALHRKASFKGSASVYTPDPSLTVRLAKLGDDVQVLLRMFYAYDKPRFARAEDEPARGQKLSARVWVTPGPQGEILPAGPARGVQPTLARAPGTHVLAPDPHLAAPTRGAVREPGAERARGIVEEPRPGRQEIVVRSWAIGGRPDRGSNASHTETQFFHWLEAQGEDFHRRVTAIELRSVLSPCGDCTTLLTGISRLVRNRPAGVRPPSLVVFWDTVYGNKEGERGPAAATFERHVVYLGDAGWIVHGPTPPA